MGALSPVPGSTWSLMANQSLFNPAKGQRTTVLRRPRFFQFEPKTPSCQLLVHDETQLLPKTEDQIPENQPSAILYSQLLKIQSPYIWTVVVPAA